MQFIEHIIEPAKLLLAWQSSDERQRTRFVVAELNRIDDQITLSYLSQSKDFDEARKKGFEAYPAFPDTSGTHRNVLDAFMRRLPPRTRGDFVQYLEGLRLKPDVHISDFALLGYSGAKLLSDGFSIIHPFTNVIGACELLLEVAGYRHIQKNHNIHINVGEQAFFSEEFNDVRQEDAIRIMVGDKHIGYVNRALIPTFWDWMRDKKIIDARVEKINGVPGRPTVYLFVKISSKSA